MRWYDPQLSRWHTIDPAEEFHTPYAYVGNDPVNLVDPDGAVAQPFDEFVFVLKDGRAQFKERISRPGNHFVSIRNDKGDLVQKITLNDPDYYGSLIGSLTEDYKIHFLKFMNKSDINNIVLPVVRQVKAKIELSSFTNDPYLGAYTPPNDRLAIVAQESLRYGLLDFSGKIPVGGTVGNGKFFYDNGKKMEGTVQAWNMLFVANGVAYDKFDFGNFMTGNAYKNIGMPYCLTVLGAHLHGLYDSARQNGISNIELDTPADQRAIKNGYYHENK